MNDISANHIFFIHTIDGDSITLSVFILITTSYNSQHRKQEHGYN